MPSDSSISVVIVTYNSKKYVMHCLRSIMNSHDVDLKEVIIVDNKSSDGTPEVIEKVFKGNNCIKVTRLHRNMGFPYACNVGMGLARSRYVVLLNPDVVVDPYCFVRLAEFLSRNSDVAVAQPKLLHSAGYIDGVGGVMDVLGHGFHLGMYERDIGQYEGLREILYASFACAMVRRDVYLGLGGMDPMYFLYNEDLDFCWRCWLAGYRVVYVPGAVAYHVGQHATRKLPYHAIYFGRRNRLYTIFTNYPLPLGITASIILLAFYMMLGLYSTTIGRDKVEAGLVLRIMAKFLKDLKYLLKKRKCITRRRGFLDLVSRGSIYFRLVGLRLYLSKLYRRQLRLK